MTTPTLHLLGLPHTQTTSTYSHCAFTGKIQRFSPMMRSVGYEVIHYGIGGAESGATDQVTVIDVDEWNTLRASIFQERYGRPPTPQDFIGDLAHTDNILYRTFNTRLKTLLNERLEPDDILCLPFGYAHRQAIDHLPHHKVETGIGYPNSYEKFRIFESQAWYHYTLGRENRSGSDYHWVIPNYYDVSEWDLHPEQGHYLLYFGRIDPIKGLDIVWEIAKHRPDLPIVLCGQGDPTPYLTLPNITYRPPVHGKDRNSLLGNALAVLMPTRYVEPFGGVTVESQLTGTPVIGSSYGSFTETITTGVNGYRCHTLGDYLQAIRAIEDGHLNRTTIRDGAATRYGMYTLAHDYDRVFGQIMDLKGLGWYTPTPTTLNGR
jgi:glycosyltransferase involved in cell wall biosynthesis